MPGLDVYQQMNQATQAFSKRNVLPFLAYVGVIENSSSLLACSNELSLMGQTNFLYNYWR